MQETKELFYLIAFQRSGTTLLCHLLDKHPQVVCAEEPELSKRIVFKQNELLKDVNFDSIEKSMAFYGVEPKEYSDLVNKYIKGELNTDIFLRSCYHLFNNKSAKVEGAKEVCDLTAFKYDYMRKLLSFHNGNAKFVFIERDIKGVVNSFIKMGFFSPGKRKINNFNFKRFAKQYLECVNYIEKCLSGKKVCYITFEELMAFPQEKLKDIFDFLGVDSSVETVKHILETPSRGIRQIYKGITPSIASSWRDRLTDRQVEWLDKIYLKGRTRGVYSESLKERFMKNAVKFFKKARVKFEKLYAEYIKRYKKSIKHGEICMAEIELYGLVKGLSKLKIKPQCIVEIGSYCGGSTVTIAKEAVRLNPDIKIYAIDPFIFDEERYKWNYEEAFDKNVNDSGLNNSVVKLKDYSFNVAKQWDKQIDFLFIDGDHGYEGVVKDINNFVPFVKEGGIIAFHDYKSAGKEGVKKAIDELVVPFHQSLFRYGCLICFRKKQI